MTKKTETKKAAPKKQVKKAPQTFTLISSIPFHQVEGYTFKELTLEVKTREEADRLLAYEGIEEVSK